MGKSIFECNCIEVMRIFFLVYHGFSEFSGTSKKMVSYLALYLKGYRHY